MYVNASLAFSFPFIYLFIPLPRIHFFFLSEKKKRLGLGLFKSLKKVSVFVGRIKKLLRKDDVLK